MPWASIEAIWSAEVFSMSTSSIFWPDVGWALASTPGFGVPPICQSQDVPGRSVLTAASAFPGASATAISATAAHSTAVALILLLLGTVHSAEQRRNGRRPLGAERPPAHRRVPGGRFTAPSSAEAAGALWGGRARPPIAVSGGGSWPAMPKPHARNRCSASSDRVIVRTGPSGVSEDTGRAAPASGKTRRDDGRE